MKPLTVITGIVLGTCLSITVSLGAVLVMFTILDGEYPRLGHEKPGLTLSLGLFACMTAISLGSFYSLLKSHRLWLPAQCLQWAAIAGIAWFYRP